MITRIVLPRIGVHLREQHTTSDHIRSCKSPCLLILLNLWLQVCIVYVGTMYLPAKVVTARSSSYQGPLQHLNNAVCIYVYLRCFTLACWHGATPGAIVCAGPCGTIIHCYHHKSRLAHKSHILAHCEIITEPKPICWYPRVSTSDYCHGKEMKKELIVLCSDNIIISYQNKTHILKILTEQKPERFGQNLY